MTIERADPLPQGRYWIDVIASDDTAREAKELVFEVWAQTHDVGVVASASIKEGALLNDDDVGTRFVFTVTNDATPQPPASLQAGFPSKADGLSIEETFEQEARPDPPDPPGLDDLVTGAKVVGGLLALYLLIKVFK